MVVLHALFPFVTLFAVLLVSSCATSPATPALPAEPQVTATPAAPAAVTPTPQATVTPMPTATATSTPQATTTPTPRATATPAIPATATPAATTVGKAPPKNVIAVESFLADIAQNVAGDRLKVASLIPLGTDPHSFEPTPADIVAVAGSDLLIVHGAGLEGFLDYLIRDAGGNHQVVEAAAGLASREPREVDPEHEEAHQSAEEQIHHHPEGDPHFWLDPNNVVKYVENIRDGLSKVDPEGAESYAANARAYIRQLRELDRWIAEQVKQVPPERRLLVTNHESFGYFADRYGFSVVGTVIPSFSTDASPSAQQMAQLIDSIRQSRARAIFLETGANPQLAQQIARETGIKVVTQLYTHSITAPGGDAPTYIDMMRYDTRAIVDALK